MDIYILLKNLVIVGIFFSMGKSVYFKKREYIWPFRYFCKRNIVWTIFQKCAFILAVHQLPLKGTMHFILRVG